MSSTHADPELGTAAPATDDKTPQQPSVVIDADYFPYIISDIVYECHRSTRLQLRLVSKKMLHLSNKYIFDHAMINDVTHEQTGKKHKGTRVFEILDGKERRLPLLDNGRVKVKITKGVSITTMANKNATTDALAAAMAYVRVLDINTTNQHVEKLARFFPVLDILRIHHADTCHNDSTYPATQFSAQTAIVFGSLLTPFSYGNSSIVPRDLYGIPGGKVVLIPMPERFSCEGHEFSRFLAFGWSENSDLVVVLSQLGSPINHFISNIIACGSTFKCFIDTLRFSLRSAIHSPNPPTSITIVGLEEILSLRHWICMFAKQLEPVDLSLNQLLNAAANWPEFSIDEEDNASHLEIFAELESFVKQGKVNVLAEQEYQSTLNDAELRLEFVPNIKLLLEVCACRDPIVQPASSAPPAGSAQPAQH